MIDIGAGEKTPQEGMTLAAEIQNLRSVKNITIAINTIGDVIQLDKYEDIIFDPAIDKVGVNRLLYSSTVRKSRRSQVRAKSRQSARVLQKSLSQAITEKQPKL